MSHRSSAFVAASIAALGCPLAACGDDDPAADWTAPSGPLVPVDGHAFIFGPNEEGLAIDGAVVAVTEAPDISTTVAADGSFRLDAPSGGPLTFSLTQPGFHPNQSATLTLGADGLPRLGFQATTQLTFELLGSIARVDPDPTRCQISTTVSRLGTEPYGGDKLGVEGVTVAIDPPLPDIDGPIYFNLSGLTPFPDRNLPSTTIDGGVIFANVPVGEYTLTATKAGTSFTPVAIRCRAGVLVNAAPPNGLQEL